MEMTQNEDGAHSFMRSQVSSMSKNTRYRDKTAQQDAPSAYA